MDRMDPTAPEPAENVAAPLFGEPFDSGLALVEHHQATPDLAAAGAVCAELLTLAESMEDTADVRFLRAHLLSDIGVLRLMAADPAAAAEPIERALGLLRGIRSVPMGPLGRRRWLEVLVKTLLGRADLLRGSGRLDEALASLDEAAALLTEFEDPEGRRSAELGLNRVHLLIERGAWGSAEELASALLATTPATVVPTVPRLLTGLGLICASTGRFASAEDYFARAEEGYRAMADTGERQQLTAHRAYAAMRRGDLDLAERLYAEASEVFERQRQFGDLAVCEQARGFLAGLRGDPARAAGLMDSSLARFERLGAVIATADTRLLSAQQAYARGDITGMRRLSQQAREVYEAQGVYERCAQVDLMLAAALEDTMDRVDHGDRLMEATGTALSLALPAALALEAARYDFVTAHARSQWLELADDAMRLVFRLAVRRQDQGLLFELVEHRCAGASLALDRTPSEASRTAPAGEWSGKGAEGVFPASGMKTHGPGGGPTLMGGGGAAEAAASVGLRVAPPPKVRMSPESGRTALQEYIEAAEFRYHRRIVSEEEVSLWTPTT
ncbi:hypothetical protein PUR49_28045 [Streptomyces sp. BE147]|uniref:hypothetical protein n=1 Tax=Streptomyces sp. BE147 TaxID=3002524 RepID=UPI002E7894A6|nr:hypothetical protein [Streptomyces sp. BE147]MEE1740311.1 hypothetical protein [Streptomyces sp. BE147]